MNHTKDQILDTAERLFAEQGYAATSLRSIIAAAGVNLAAIHYHFRSKEALLEAVVVRRSQPANQERLKLLENFQQAAGSAPVSLEQVMEAFLAPTFRMAQDSASGGRVFMRLLGRLHAEGDLLSGILKAQSSDVLERFAAALRRALPDLEPEELFWRLNFSIGALAQTLRGGSKELAAIADFPVSFDAENALARLIAFLSAGFRAPVPYEKVHRLHAGEER